ncbi:MAG: transcription antitermination factor NusB [Candidatus Aminicenantaceae bacterium]|jgi:N utilization substance protein B
MGKRRKARESTLQILFQLEFNDSDAEKAFRQYWKDKKATKEVKDYCRWLIKGITSHQESIDRSIQSVSKRWRLSRMPVVDRNILRMAVFELLYEEDVAPAIIINEAIEISKKFSGEQAAMFINGVLDTLRKNANEEKESVRDKEND